ncbi:MAG: Hsp20/alpha crystallin family protein [Flavobacteriales bacterium]|nr:Hsp20/alpha crystallin family protein [Flavobacteriia bacterium]NCP07176.1 Hsp20/alpha crystallin family protein [Flavobacteriales bacterium]PIV92527.1 MAG: heat-shock protein [Flavobacteriaceae bacterium CG17_big_fil_post_rev_8_21_14_2_50_33_15]PIY09562.1 MAG: heat-shock protein [Flavobacteriaceae bacterium CG_4_10_14_3_um_filter_33_47]PJB17516.1 MAG: heat-shock protein [Flavobacteriaceae bacterium CG_4_9_14_3_um_filter_33_16]
MSILIPTVKSDSRKATETSFNRLPSLPSWFDDILGKGFGNEFMTNFNTGITLPAVNVIDNANEFIVEMAVPGFKKTDFQINIDNNVLSVGAESKSESQENAENFTRREFGYASFKRTFAIPDSVDSEHISAEYQDGILKVTLPKRDEAKKKPIKTIEIK